MIYYTTLIKKTLTPEEQIKLTYFENLAKEVKNKQSQNLAKRLSSNPYATKEENALGAFLEMYEPHLIPMVMAFLEKGQLLEPASGFKKDNPDCQVLIGQFTLDEKIIAALMKIQVTVQKEKNNKSLKFYPKEANLQEIVETFERILQIFPVHKGDIQISLTASAKKFRRTYTPQDSDLQHTRLFEILMHETHEQVAADLEKRLKTNPKPTQTELNLGVFIEMIEPQVRDAILEFYRKGYSTDTSGFKGRSDLQWIEGDFSLPEKVRKDLEAESVWVNTNHSGYTTIQFQPTKADFDMIYKKWMRIASILPDRKTSAQPTMTASAREFRKKHASAK